MAGKRGGATIRDSSAPFPLSLKKLENRPNQTAAGEPVSEGWEATDSPDLSAAITRAQTKNSRSSSERREEGLVFMEARAMKGWKLS